MKRNIALYLVVLLAAVAAYGCKTAAGPKPFVPYISARPDHRVRVLYVEGTPRWEYRYLKNVLIRKKDEMVVWCLLLSADKDFAQEHTPGSYIDDKGVEQKIQPLTTFPTPEELANFDVIIWGDVNPIAGVYGVTPVVLKSVAQFVRNGGGLLCILGENYLPSHYARGEEGEALGAILPFKITKPEHGEETKPFEPFKFQLNDAGKASPVFKMTDGDNAKLWAEGKEDMPGVYWFWRVESDPAQTHGATVFVRHATEKPQGAQANYALFFEKPVGKGIVFVAAIDETWRWRYQYGDEPYFGPFWIRVVKHLAGAAPPQQPAARHSEAAANQRSG